MFVAWDAHQASAGDMAGMASGSLSAINQYTGQPSTVLLLVNQTQADVVGMYPHQMPETLIGRIEDFPSTSLQYGYTLVMGTSQHT